MTNAANITGAAMPVSGVPKNLGLGRAVVMLAPVAAAAVLYGLGWLVLKSFNWMGYERELLAATLISLAAGLASSLPMALWMGKGAVAVVRLAMVAMLVRGGVTFAGLVLACGQGWHLDKGILVVCTCAGYGMLMIFENGATLWATRH